MKEKKDLRVDLNPQGGGKSGRTNAWGLPSGGGVHYGKFLFLFFFVSLSR